MHDICLFSPGFTLPSLRIAWWASQGIPLINTTVGILESHQRPYNNLHKAFGSHSSEGFLIKQVPFVSDVE